MQMEFSEEELEPIEIVRSSLSALGDMRIADLRAMLNENKVVFLEEHNTGRFYAMVSSINFEFLLEVAQTLRSDQQFMLAPVLLEGIG